jgi:hypothetical protein
MPKIFLKNIVIRNLNHITIRTIRKTVMNSRTIEYPVSPKRRGNRTRKRIKIIKLNTDFIA